MSLARIHKPKPFLTIKNASCFAALPDGDRLAVARSGRTPRARLVSLTTGSDVLPFEVQHGSVCVMAVSADGEWVAFGRRNTDVLLCTASNGCRHELLRLPHGGELLGLAFAPHTGELIHLTPQAISLLDVHAGGCTGQIHVCKGLVARSPVFRGLAFSRQGDRLAVVWQRSERGGRERHFLTLLAWPDGAELTCLELPVEPQRVLFSPEGMELFVTDAAGGVHAWEVVAGRLAWTMQANGGSAAAGPIVFSPSGHLLIQEHQQKLLLWQFPERERLAEWALPGACTALACTQDGQQLIVGLAAKLAIYNVSELLNRSG